MNIKRDKAKRVFKKINALTIALLFILILAGSIVRSTGSGMGCPDWPKCFGQWIPPTQVEQLPVDYKEKFAEERRIKNVRLAAYLSKLGYSGLAQQIVGDPDIYNEPDFNAIKTWTEYINRLIGALIGVFMLAGTFYSFSWRKEKLSVPVLSVLALVLVVIQAWIGSVVVSTNLLPGTISLHMSLALILGLMLIWNQVSVMAVPYLKSVNLRSIHPLLWIALVVTGFQIMLGVQVREQVDDISAAMNYGQRHLWLEGVGKSLNIHKMTSILVGGAGLLLTYLGYNSGNSFINRWTSLLGVGIILEIVAGLVLLSFGIPAFVQPIHLTVAIGIFAIEWYLISVFFKNKQRLVKE